jgi:hypothetical protein
MSAEEIRQFFLRDKKTEENLGEIIQNSVGCRVAARNGVFRSLKLSKLAIKYNCRYLGF